MIKVPDIEGPIKELCWHQAPDMVRCDREKGHSGMHSWEMYNFIKRVEDLVNKLLDNV